MGASTVIFGHQGSASETVAMYLIVPVPARIQLSVNASPLTYGRITFAHGTAASLEQSVT